MTVEGTPEPKCSQATSCRGVFTPSTACPRPTQQPVHQTQIPVHGYDATTGPPFVTPREGGQFGDPGSITHALPLTVPPNVPHYAAHDLAHTTIR